MALNDAPSIDHPQRAKEDGSIGITDAGKYARRVWISNESLPVIVNETPGLPDGFSYLNVFNQLSGVPVASEQTIVSYTVGAGTELILSRVDVGGENKGTYTVEIDGVVEALKRTYYTKYDTEFLFNRLIVQAGSTIDIKVIHNGDGSSDHEARIAGVLETL